MLERRMQEIGELPDRVTKLESQILHLREEMRVLYEDVLSRLEAMGAAYGSDDSGE